MSTPISIAEEAQELMLVFLDANYSKSITQIRNSSNVAFIKERQL